MKQDLLLLKETEEMFGYKIKDLTYGSTRWIVHKCDVCGKPKKTRYKNFVNGLALSHRKCSSIKRRKTCLQKYGVEHISQSSKIKKQRSETLMKHYGVTYPSKSKEIQSRMRQTNLRKRGVEWPTQSSEVRAKVKETFLTNYNGKHPRQTEEIQEKQRRSFQQMWLLKQGIECAIENVEEAVLSYIRQELLKEGYTLLSKTYINSRTKILVECPKRDRYSVTWNDWRSSKARCPICQEFKGEKKLRKILKKIYPGQVLMSQDNLGFLERQRVDFSIRDLSLAFEYDGKQHFEPVTFGGMTEEQAIEVFLYIQDCDKRKNKLCEENGYILVRIRYNEKLSEDLVRQKLIGLNVNTEDSNG